MACSRLDATDGILNDWFMKSSTKTLQSLTLPEHGTSRSEEPLCYLNEGRKGTSFLNPFCINLHRFVSPITLFYNFIFSLKISVQSYYAASRDLFVLILNVYIYIGVRDLSCLFLNEPEIKCVINEHVCCNFILFYSEVKPRSGLSLHGRDHCMRVTRFLLQISTAREPDIRFVTLGISFYHSAIFTA